MEDKTNVPCDFGITEAGNTYSVKTCKVCNASFIENMEDTWAEIKAKELSVCKERCP